ncbi:hypothetical protein GCM10009624_31000 [Gordonia sinesedis]
MLAGAGPWGFVQVSYARHWVCHRLVVLPPGTMAAQRRWMRVWRLLPALVTVSVLGTMYAAALGGLGAPTAIGVSALVGATLAFVVGSRTARIRNTVRDIESWCGDHVDARSVPERCTIFRLSTALRDADDALREGRIDAVEHELVWARCYAEIPVTPRRRPALALADAGIKRPQ